MHGDSLCTDDVEYMAFRAQVRNPAWQKEFLAKSVAERDLIVRNIREISKTSTASKKPEIMDVNQNAVETVMREHGVQRLIHGHTHRPQEHAFMLDGRPARRMVLGDWYEQGSVLSVDARGWMLEGLPLEKNVKSGKMKVKS
jgi:UDP-2,3-diacylglucosamine hydrolase